MKKPHPKSKENQLLEDYISSMLSPVGSDEAMQNEEPPEKSGSKGTSSHPVADQVTQTIETDPVKHFAGNAKTETESHETPIKAQFQKASDREDFSEHPPELDPRLEKVQSLLAKIPAALKVAQAEDTKVEAEVKVKRVEAVKPPVTKEKTQTKTKSEAQPKIQSQQASTQTQQSESVDTEEGLTAGNELLAEDVTREVARAREILGNAFQTLIFDVGKLPLAVPLVKLGGIHAYSEEDITPIFGTPDWFKGLIPSEHGNIMLVDTARYIMPEKYDQIKDDLDYKYAILLDDTRWALACTNVREAKTMSIDDIRWAQKGTRKEWFAGMVVQFMCALLEVDSLINALYRTGQKQKNR